MDEKTRELISECVADYEEVLAKQGEQLHMMGNELAIMELDLETARTDLERREDEVWRLIVLCAGLLLVLLIVLMGGVKP